MIDVADARATLEKLPGDHVINLKAHVAELLTEVEQGQLAKRQLAELRAAVSVAAIAADAALRKAA